MDNLPENVTPSRSSEISNIFAATAPMWTGSILKGMVSI
jgi:hypothetical protein